MTIEQKYRKESGYIDEELLRDKQGKKVFKAAAYSMGIGVGFFIVQPLLPDIGDKEKSDAMMNIFQTIALLMIGYSASLTLAFFFFRSNVKLVLFMLNWVLVPLVGLWCVTEGYKVLTH